MACPEQSPKKNKYVFQCCVYKMLTVALAFVAPNVPNVPNGSIVHTPTCCCTHCCCDGLSDKNRNVEKVRKDEVLKSFEQRHVMRVLTHTHTHTHIYIVVIVRSLKDSCLDDLVVDWTKNQFEFISYTDTSRYLRSIWHDSHTILLSFAGSVYPFVYHHTIIITIFFSLLLFECRIYERRARFFYIK